MQILQNETELENADLSAAYNAINQVGEITARFKKKEDLETISKSILKHRIQTLTGRNIRKLEEEMNYKPVDINETGMNIEVMKKLAHCLILLANGELKLTQAQAAPVVAPAPVAVNGKKRGASDDEAPPVKAKVGRRSLALPKVLEDQEVATPRRGRKSLATPLVTQSPARTSRRSVTSTPATPKQRNSTSFNTSASASEASVAVRCLGPKNGVEDKLQNLEEEDEEEEAGQFSNPTPAMKELLKKRRSMPAAKSPKKSPKKAAATSKTAVSKQAQAASRFSPEPEPAPEPEPEPRQEFVGKGGSKTFLMAGEPMELKFEKIQRKLPLSLPFPGAHLTVVHTPATWTPQEIYRMTKNVKHLNKSAGLQSFVVLIGTGLTNVHMNIEAMLRATQHVQLVVFDREDANVNIQTGKLRDTTSFFLAGYFFPGCEKEESVLPSIMVREGFTTCIRAASIEDLEDKIIKCFSERGEWVLDLFCGRRKLTLSAAENGRNGIAVSPDPEDLEDMGNFLRTLALREDKSYREEDGLVAFLDKL